MRVHSLQGKLNSQLEVSGEGMMIGKLGIKTAQWSILWDLSMSSYQAPVALVLRMLCYMAAGVVLH